jgi:hypothetical protein
LNGFGPPRSRRATKETFCAEVLIHIRPVNAKSAACEAPVFALRWRGRQQTGIPGKRNGYRSAVQEIDDQGVLRKPDAFDALTCFDA